MSTCRNSGVSKTSARMSASLRCVFACTVCALTLAQAGCYRYGVSLRLQAKSGEPEIKKGKFLREEAVKEEALPSEGVRLDLTHASRYRVAASVAERVQKRLTVQRVYEKVSRRTVYRFEHTGWRSKFNAVGWNGLSLFGLAGFVVFFYVLFLRILFQWSAWRRRSGTTSAKGTTSSSKRTSVTDGVLLDDAEDVYDDNCADEIPDLDSLYLSAPAQKRARKDFVFAVSIFAAMGIVSVGFALFPFVWGYSLRGLSEESSKGGKLVSSVEECVRGRPNP